MDAGDLVELGIDLRHPDLPIKILTTSPEGVEAAAGKRTRLDILHAEGPLETLLRGQCFGLLLASPTAHQLLCKHKGIHSQTATKDFNIAW